MNQISHSLRFAYGALAGLAGSIILGITLFAGWGILGDVLTTTQETINNFGITEKAYQLHPLFHVLVVLAVFLSGLTTFVTHSILYSFHFPNKNRKFLITQVLFSQIALLTIFLPLYFLSTYYGVTNIIGAVALLHIILGSLLTFSILEKPSLLRLVGFAFGLVMFFAVFIILGQYVITGMILLTLPLLQGFTQLGEGWMEFWYNKMSETYGVELLEENASLIKNQTSTDDEDVWED